MRKILTITVMLILGVTYLWAQNPRVTKPAFFGELKPLKEKSPEASFQAKPERTWKQYEIRNKLKDIPLLNKQNALPKNGDPVWQKFQGKAASRGFVNTYDGINTIDNGNATGSLVAPPDTDGDVGHDHYLQMVNHMFEIFDKDGNSVYGPALLHTIWEDMPGPWDGVNNGDPIVLYDEQAERWMVSQFALDFSTADGKNYELVAISKGPDPVNDGWYGYAYETSTFPDYPKFGVWKDAYYMSTQDGYGGAYAYAFEREKMIAGDPTAQVIEIPFSDLVTTSGFTVCMPADCNGNWHPDGMPGLYFRFIDDAWASGVNDHIRMWQFDVDWNNPNNSTLELLTTLDTEPFDSDMGGFGAQTIEQPMSAQGLDPNSLTTMMCLNYRNFGSYQAMVTNHTVDVDDSDHAGIRWYELRDEGAGWYIYQQGTYAPDADHRWMGSMAMDGQGNIALGYSVSSSTTYPSVRYTGRYNDGQNLGYMTIPEGSIYEGTVSQEGVYRWGDYSMMSVDPSDNATFWYTQEHGSDTYGSYNWGTKIGEFQLDQPIQNDLSLAGIIAPETDMALSSNEEVTIKILNNGVKPQKDFQVSYIIDNGTPVVETVNQTVPPFEFIEYTFNTRADFSIRNNLYILEASVMLDGDEAPGNNSFTKEILTNPYCSISFGTPDEYIKNVNIGDIDNTSGWTPFSDYSMQSTPLAFGTSEHIVVTTGSSWSSDQLGIYIDWNDDGVFNEEMIETERTSYVFFGDATYEADIEAPYPNIDGPKKMRIVLLYGGEPQPCGVFSYGEAEDYTLEVVYSVVENDVAAVDIDLEQNTPAGPTMVTANVMNSGLKAASFGATLEAFGEKTSTSTPNIPAYSQTVMIENLQPGETKEIVFPVWNIEEGEYTVKLSVISDKDGYEDNNTVEMNIEATNSQLAYSMIYWYYWLYGELYTAGAYYLNDINGFIPYGTLLENSSIFMAATWKGDNWYTYDYANGQLYTSDTEVGPTSNIHPVGDPSYINFLGMTYNAIENNLYASDGLSLYKVDSETGEVTFHKEIEGPNEGFDMFLNLTCNYMGEMYSINYYDDCLYRIDANTGVATKVGPLGVFTSFAPQGLAFDNNTGRLYLSFIPYGMIDVEQYEINPLTGQAIYQETWDYSVWQVSGTAIPWNDQEARSEADILAFNIPGLTDIYSQTSSQEVHKPAFSGIKSITLEEKQNVKLRTKDEKGKVKDIEASVRINEVDGTIDLIVPYGTNLINLKAEFVLSPGATAYVEGKEVESGDYFDFTFPIIYTIRAADNTTMKDWKVSVHTDIYTFDFSDMSNWEFSNDGKSNDANWTITTDGPQGPFAIDKINSRTSHNGFAMFDSDAQCGDHHVASITTASPIDLSNYENVLLSFEQYYKRANDKTLVYVSNDKVNWIKYEVNKSLNLNNKTKNAEMVTIDISDIADNQKYVYLRFTYFSSKEMGAGAGCGYAWMIDDIRIHQAPQTGTMFTAFSVPGQLGETTMDPVNHTIDLMVDYNVDMHDLVAEFEISDGAIASHEGHIMESGVDHMDLSTPVMIKVVAQNGEWTMWQVNVTQYVQNDCAEIFNLSFSPEANPWLKYPVIAEPIDNFLVFNMPADAHLGYLIPTFDVCENATVEIRNAVTNQMHQQVSGQTAYDYSKPVLIVVTSEDGQNQRQYWVEIKLGGTTSIDANDLNTLVNIYPNPAKAQVNITCSEGSQIQVYNMIGSLVYNKQNASAISTINVSDFAQGSYIVKVIKSEQVVTKKFEVMK